MKQYASIKKLQALMQRKSVDLVILWPSANWRYLISFAPIAVERPTFLFISREETCSVVPDFDRNEFLERTGLEHVYSWTDQEGPSEAVKQAWEKIKGKKAERLALDDTMPFIYLKALEPHLGEKSTQLASDILIELRKIKDKNEIEAIRRTSALIEKAISRVGEFIRPGVTEKEVEARLKGLLLEEGADTLDYVLVQATPNSASPHHMPDKTTVKKGEPVLLDIAVSSGGYFSDITRQLCLSEPKKEYWKAFEVVRKAQAEAVERVKPGRRVSEIDSAARKVIEEAGMGEYFKTRTGHGLGLEVHEPPSVWGGNSSLLESGMVFTIEPGVYIPDKFGVRIEDTVVVTEKGARRLTESERDLIIL